MKILTDMKHEQLHFHCKLLKTSGSLSEYHIHGKLNLIQYYNDHIKVIVKPKIFYALYWIKRVL